MSNRIETNIRIVEPKKDLYLLTRCAKIITSEHSPKIREKVCIRLASRNLAAVYCPIRKRILVFTKGRVPSLEVKEENWIIQVEDSGSNQRLQFSRSENDASLLAQLIERYILIQIKLRLKMQTVDSTRIFQVIEPFKTVDGIDVHRRFEVSAVAIKDVGVGISVDISMSFFTQKTVADIFRCDIPSLEQQRLRQDFESLSQRQYGQKGTLLYDLGNRQTKCYFEKPIQGKTCATIGPLFVKGQTYSSLLEYYRQKYPHLKIHANDSVVMVSFKGIDQPQPVAAKLLRLRVMNDALPGSLKRIDKLMPYERARLISGFWKDLGDDLFGLGKPYVARNFWQPPSEIITDLLPPGLQFSGGAILPPPQRRDHMEFQRHYHQRSALLHKNGCLGIPVMMESVVHFAVPKKATEEMRGALLMDITEYLNQLTKKHITPQLITYETLDEVYSELNNQVNPGIVVFVFDDESPETYYNVAYELSDWRVKRITFRKLQNKFDQLKSTSNHCGSQLSRAEKGWNSFTEMIALDVLQQMDCVFWGFKDASGYDAHLAIDVGRDRRHFALSLLILHPSLRIRTVVEQKFDSKHETINKTILREEIVKLFEKAAEWSDFQSLRSVLVLRDGRECGRELDGINEAVETLVADRLIVEEAQIDVVDFHKSIKKEVRLWERTQSNRIEQGLEGEAVLIDKRTVVLITTGFPTLRQGTAAPIMLVGQSANIDMVRVARAVYASTHLNFSNPKVAQRLPLELKRTDDELKNRDSQQIRGIR